MILTVLPTIKSLPEAIKQRIVHLLEQNNFTAAKRCRDEWMNSQKQTVNSYS